VFFLLGTLVALSLLILWLRLKISLRSALSVWVLICVAGTAWVWVFLVDEQAAGMLATIRLVSSAQIFLILGLAALPGALLPQSVPFLPRFVASIAAPGIVTYFFLEVFFATCLAVAGAAGGECVP
jgi:hypothetical protein